MSRICRNPENPVATVGLLMMRSYVLASDTAHYDGVIRKMQDAGLAVIPAFAGGLDGPPRDVPPISEGGRIDALVSLTGFSLIGGPAYNDSAAAVEVLKGLDVPYIRGASDRVPDAGAMGLVRRGASGRSRRRCWWPCPEIDGATNPDCVRRPSRARGLQGMLPTTARGLPTPRRWRPAWSGSTALWKRPSALPCCAARRTPRRR